MKFRRSVFTWSWKSTATYWADKWFIASVFSVVPSKFVRSGKFPLAPWPWAGVRFFTWKWFYEHLSWSFVQFLTENYLCGSFGGLSSVSSLYTPCHSRDNHSNGPKISIFVNICRILICFILTSLTLLALVSGLSLCIEDFGDENPESFDADSASFAKI